MRIVTASAVSVHVPESDEAAGLSLGEAEFRAFYEDTARGLRGWLRRVMPPDAVDDALQEAYLRLLRTPHAALPVQERRAYLYRIASNLVTDRWRRQRKERGAGVAPAPDTLAAPPVSQGDRLDVTRALERLRIQERTLLWLAYVEQASHREIASALEVKEASVRVLLSRARRKLAAALGLSR